MTMNPSHPDDVPVSAGLLCIVMAVRYAGAFYRQESSLAEQFKQPDPGSYFKRCEDLFTKTYGEQAKQAGLSLNRITFEAIIFMEPPSEVLSTDYDALPKSWIFNPYRGWRKV